MKCEQCGKEFSAKRSDARFCGVACRVADLRKKAAQRAGKPPGRRGRPPKPKAAVKTLRKGKHAPESRCVRNTGVVVESEVPAEGIGGLSREEVMWLQRAATGVKIEQGGEEYQARTLQVRGVTGIGTEPGEALRDWIEAAADWVKLMRGRVLPEC